jgi:hypothetical protein
VNDGNVSPRLCQVNGYPSATWAAGQYFEAMGTVKVSATWVAGQHLEAMGTVKILCRIVSDRGWAEYDCLEGLLSQGTARWVKRYTSIFDI